METSGNAGGADSPEPERRSGPPSAGETPSRSSMLASIAGFLLLVLLGLVLLVAVSAFAVYATGVAARRIGVLELHVTLSFFGLLALLVVLFLGLRIRSAIEAAARGIQAAIQDAGDRVGSDVEELTGVMDDLPVMVVDPRRPAGRRPPR